MPTIFDPDILQAKQYVCSDAMKDVLEDYGSPVSGVEQIITAVGAMAQLADETQLKDRLAETVNVRIGDSTQILPAPKALTEFRRLTDIPAGVQQLYDEAQMIFTSEAIGLANGVVWIELKYTIEPLFGAEVVRTDLRVIALNLAH